MSLTTAAFPAPRCPLTARQRIDTIRGVTAGVGIAAVKRTVAVIPADTVTGVSIVSSAVRKVPCRVRRPVGAVPRRAIDRAVIDGRRVRIVSEKIRRNRAVGRPQHAYIVGILLEADAGGNHRITVDGCGHLSINGPLAK